LDVENGILSIEERLIEILERLSN